MCFSTITQSIWIDHFENNTKEQDKGEAQCQSAGLNATIHYATCSRQPFAVTRSYCDRSGYFDLLVAFYA